MKLTIDGEEIPLNEEDESCGNKLAVVGCCFCLCTLCLSWVPMCCWCSSMKDKYKNGGGGGNEQNNHNEEAHHQQKNHDGNDNYNNDPVYGVPVASNNINNNSGAPQCAGPVGTPPRSPARSPNGSSCSN